MLDSPARSLGVLLIPGLLILIAVLTAPGGSTREHRPLPTQVQARTQVRAVVRRYGVAVARKDYRQICNALIAKTLVNNVEQLGLPCPAAFKQGLNSVKGPGLQIRAVSVRRGVALVKVHTTAVNQPSSDDTLKLVRVGRGWRIASLSAGGAPSRGSATATSVPGTP